MYTELQLQFIRRFGRKDLEFGCIVMADNGYGITVKCIGHGYIFNNGKSYQEHPTDEYSDDIKEILGHEPHLEDVFRVAEEKLLENDICILKDELRLIIYSDKKIARHVEIPFNPTLPLIQQESVMQQLLDLFPEKI